MSQYDEIGRAKPYGIRIGTVCDLFFYESVCSAVDVRYIPPEDAFFDKVRDIDLLLVLSTWHGLNNREWFGLCKDDSPLCLRLLALIAECRRHHVKTVFYSKEDPPHFELFKKFAVACDYVFTTCEEKVDEYRKVCGHDRVWTMPFCINTEHSNPLDTPVESSNSPTVVFSGSWMKKYPQRCQCLRMLFEGVGEAGYNLLIYDRNTWRDNPKWQYPKRYAANVHPEVAYRELREIHMRHRWALNVNSITDSATMFAFRVYELLAGGIHVISNYSFGMHRHFPAVSIAYSPQIVADILTRTPEGVLEFQRANGIRETITHYSAHVVLGEIFARIGGPQKANMPTVAVIADDVGAAEAALSLQTCRSFKVIGTDSAGVADSRVFDGVMRFSAGVDYSPFFVEDAVNALAYSDVDAVSAGSDRKWWYRIAPLEHGDSRYLVARRGTALAESMTSGTQLAADDARCFIMPMSAVDGTVYGPCGVVVAKLPKLRIRVLVGDDWRGLLLGTMPSLLRCRRFGEFGIVLAGISGQSPLARYFAEKLARDFGNVRIEDEGETSEPGTIELRAGDEVFASAFDNLVAKLGGAFTASVEGDVLLCGRSVRIVTRGVSVKMRSHGFVRYERVPVMCRYGAWDESVGEVYCPLPRKSVAQRIVKCYQDNGLWKTLRRALLGKRLGGCKTAVGGIVR